MTVDQLDLTDTSAQSSLEDRLDAMAGQIDLLVAAERRRHQLLADVTGDLTPIMRQAITALSEGLEDAEQRGYLGFVRELMGLGDRVATSFSPQDVRALSDNVVTILEALREMTQPEVMSMVRRAAHVVGEPADATTPPRSLIGIARELREPSVRQGLDQLLGVLRSMGEAQNHTTNPKQENSQ